MPLTGPQHRTAWTPYSEAFGLHGYLLVIRRLSWGGGTPPYSADSPGNSNDPLNAPDANSVYVRRRRMNQYQHRPAGLMRSYDKPPPLRCYICHSNQGCRFCYLTRYFQHINLIRNIPHLPPPKRGGGVEITWTPIQTFWTCSSQNFCFSVRKVCCVMSALRDSH